jgi:hypothetical protein
MRVMTGGLLALLLLAGCQQGTSRAVADSCAAPADWRATYTKPSQPQAELGACLKFQAYKMRKLDIPLGRRGWGLVVGFWRGWLSRLWALPRGVSDRSPVAEKGWR